MTDPNIPFLNDLIAQGFRSKESLAAEKGVLPQTIERRACPSIATIERINVAGITLYREVRDETNDTTPRPSRATTPKFTPMNAIQPNDGVHIVEVRENPNFMYNGDADVYIARIGGKTYEVSKETHEAIRSDYTNEGGGMTIKDLAATYDRTVKWMGAYIRVSAMTHGDGIFTDETLADDMSVTELLARRRELQAASARQAMQAKHEAQVRKNSKLWMAREAATEEFIQQFNVAASLPVRKLVPTGDGMGRFSLFLTASDFHFGKWSHPSNCQFPYSRHVAQRLLYKKVSELATSVLSVGRPEFTYIGVGSDWFHIDNYEGTTTKGTKQDIDGTPEVIFSEGQQVFLNFVNMVRQFSDNVVLVYMPGNHDRVKSLDLYNLCRAHYQDDSDVIVTEALENDSTNPVQVNYYGSNIIVTLHGDRRNLKSTKFFSTLLSRIQKRHVEDRIIVFTGDKHHDRVIDEGGVHIEQMMSLSGDDRWHTNSGYVGSGRGLCGYLISYDRGLMHKMIAPASPSEYRELFDEGQGK